MSDHLAIAAVTWTLRMLVESAAKAAVPGALVKTGPPGAAAPADPASRVHVFLYQVSPNAAHRNDDLPTRRANGTLVARPQLALDLRYLLTFYGDDRIHQPERMLGRVMSELHTHPSVTRDEIEAAVNVAIADANGDYAYFEDANLLDRVGPVRFSPLSLSLEELSKLWSIFFQETYRLSVAFAGSLVLIEAPASPQDALAVATRNVAAVALAPPSIGSVDPPVLTWATDARIAIAGSNLGGSDCVVRFGALETEPSVSTPDRLLVGLPQGIRAGVRRVTVARTGVYGEPPRLRPGAESNAGAFVLQPRIGTPAVTPAAGPDGGYQVSVPVQPSVGPRQRLELLLTEVDAPGDRPPKVHTIVAPERDTPSESVTFRVAGVPPANYLVALRVDGAQSPLERNLASGADHGRYEGPVAVIPA